MKEKITYICEFCGKSMKIKSHMENHEKVCYYNKNPQSCLNCKYGVLVNSVDKECKIIDAIKNLYLSLYCVKRKKYRQIWWHETCNENEIANKCFPIGGVLLKNIFETPKIEEVNITNVEEIRNKQYQLIQNILKEEKPRNE